MARPRVHDDALRTRLLEVTSEVIAAEGEGAVTVRGVAAAAGTSASAVYALFGSREALVAEVSAEGFRRFGQRLAAVPRTADPGADLLALGLAYRDSALAAPHFYRVMFERAVAPAGRHGPSTEHATFGVLRDAVARTLGPDAPAARAQDAALALWGLVHGLVSLDLAGLAPGNDAARAARYRAALEAAGPALLG
ncbi:TetR/AcrR family transcriptional regulator [Puerhibacterium puerhi]|uniref:TetR/AcrR family transcriptional regulator n=1 Tax=Puerhibacterium puerhi TaxID=2692623 RepID=UPI00135CACAA|nr:TetR-like C-terminal domain-containing protein [Puerhibacterium puerhi]